MRPRVAAPITLFVLCILVGACGGGGTGNSAPTAPTPTPTPPPAPTPTINVGAVDPALVGTWNGTLNGSFGPGTFTMILNTNGRLESQGSGNYCGVAGNWGVSEGEFMATGPDCTGTIVTFRAPASGSVMSGQWTASSGRSGVFDCTRQ